MSANTKKISVWSVRVTVLSLLLLFFTIPHSLEDFSVGEPQKAGVSVLVLAFGVASLFALQGLALFWTGRGSSRGYALQAMLGLLWPLAAGAAQLPVILEPGPYRAGPVSEFLVFGIILVGILLAIASVMAFMTARASEKINRISQ